VPKGSALLEPEIAGFLAGPVSAFLGTADALAVPDVTRASGVVRVDDRHLRVLIAAAATTARANAVVGARASVIVTDITTYRSLQWKGVVVAAGGERTPGDLAVLHRHVDAFVGSSERVGIPAEMADRFFPLEVVPVVLAVEELYDQTPGPAAGRRIGAEP
jgi:hypothetical protein